MKQNQPSIEEIRHSLAHALAAAAQRLYPKVQFGIGPTIENGFYYDFGNISLKEEDLRRLEEEMRKVIAEGHAFKKELWPAAKAKAHFKKLNQPYKIELIEDLQKEQKAKKGKTSDLKVGMVSTGTVFLDLCRGGHVKNTKEIPADAFALVKTAGAYWRGDEKRPMLTRVYGVAFSSKRELDEYRERMKEAERRDHRKLGRELGLFAFSDLVGAGLPLYTAKGAYILRKIKEYSSQFRKEMGYEEVHTPQITRAELFKVSGHYEKYKEDMFLVSSNYSGEEMFLKPMNCPQHTQIYASQPRSYKDLPLRIADFANLYRDEKPGELNGLARLRAFSQDDGHCFCAQDEEQIKTELRKVFSAIQRSMSAYGMQYWIRLSLRDEKNKAKYIGDDKTWKKAQKFLEDFLVAEHIPFKPAQGEAAFYGPKMDLIAKDSLGREWQLSTIQVDFNTPTRFGLTYTGKDGKEYTPAMIHSALVGSPERFFGILIEHYAGAFPLWLAPEQVWILPISDALNAYAREIKELLIKEAGGEARVMVREENETLGKKIREGETHKIPYLLIVGEKEQTAKTISVRKRGKGDLGSMAPSAFAKQIQKEIQEKQ